MYECTFLKSLSRKTKKSRSKEENNLFLSHRKSSYQNIAAFHYRMINFSAFYFEGMQEYHSHLRQQVLLEGWFDCGLDVLVVGSVEQIFGTSYSVPNPRESAPS